MDDPCSNCAELEKRITDLEDENTILENDCIDYKKTINGLEQKVIALETDFSEIKDLVDEKILYQKRHG